MKTEDYKRWVSGHLFKAANLDLQSNLIDLFEEVNGLIEKWKMDLSVQDEQFLRQSLVKQEIPFPKIFIKYHKIIN